ncbi:MAG: competence/damage-inducible protein A [Candidatus Caenarcaniphilales bacterium]|nr:competence/damage-inducible protein A [Candidatus Caenarcaniphilales bacterium]
MKAELIAIGTELLIGHVVNSNATYLSEELNAIGISTHFHVTVGDNQERILKTLELAASRADIIICTGGLGPTVDDITHEVLAEFAGKPLLEDPQIKEVIKNKFLKTKKDIPQNNYKQALIPEGAIIIPNPVGTAVGVILDYKGIKIISFPGVPCEMKAMFKETIAPYLSAYLAEKESLAAIESEKIKFINIGESQMAEMIGEEIFMQSNPSVAPYATLGECYVRITAKAESASEAKKLMAPVKEKIEAKMKDYIYSYGDDTVPEILSNFLKEKNLSIAFAESCTGGLLSKTMTDIPGASSYTKLNLVTYSNESKEQFLNVSKETLDKHGAVSEETAKEMVLGLQKISNANLNISITGIAGPDGGTPEKPIGTIYIGLAFNEKVEIHKLDWFARTLNRAQVRELACLKTLYKAYKFLLKNIA